MFKTGIMQNFKNVPVIRIFQGIAVLFIFLFLYNFLVNSFGVFLFPLIFPFFIFAILFLYISLKQSSNKLKKYLPLFILCSSVSIVFLVFLGFGWRILLNTSLFTQKIPPLSGNDYARCAWLPKIPRDWVCYDRWNGSTRYLTAENPKNKKEYIQLQIEKDNPLMPPCIASYPISGLVFASASGLTIPLKCLSLDGLMYKADWSQDGTHFRLIARNISSNLFFNNLDMHRGNYTSDKDKLTINPNYEFNPKKVSLFSNKDSEIELSNTNICKTSNELNENIILKIADEPLTLVEIKNDSGECILLFKFSDSNLKPGFYEVTTEVNGLKQLLKDKIEVII